MLADWGARLERLPQGGLPSEIGVTPVMRRDGNSRYVSEVPVVTPVTFGEVVRLCWGAAYQ
jgi:hypothetical protein